MTTYILLTANGLHNSAQLDIEQDFNFFVGPHQYQCTKTLASFISPTISKLLKNDIATSFFYIDHPDENNEFNQVMSLMSGSALPLTKENKNYLLSMAIQLGNEEIINLILDSSGKLTNENVIQRIILKHSNNINYNEEAKYLASHFDDFSVSDLCCLDVDVLDLVLNQPTLSIFNEDSLFERIIGLGEKYYSLFENVKIEYLSTDSICKFFEYIEYDSISSDLWNSIKNRLKLPVNPVENPQRHSSTFVLDNEYPFDGVFASMMEKYGENVHDKGIVKITASSDPDKNVKLVSDSDWESYWFSDDSPNSWVQFDFLKYKIAITDYTIESDGSDGNHLLHWVLEASDDQKTWETIDKRDVNDLNGFYKVGSYSCSKVKPFRFVRIKQTGKNSSNQNYMLLASIEFYGRLVKM